jgi:hypothetical protein
MQDSRIEYSLGKMRLLIGHILGYPRSSSEQPAAITGLSAVDGENLTATALVIQREGETSIK